MIPQGFRINYGEYVLSAEHIFAGTIICFKDDFIEHSYMISGRLEHLDGCGPFEGDVVTGGMHRRIKDTLYADDGKLVKRYVAIHESGILLCFISYKRHMDISFINVDNEMLTEQGIEYIVIEGSFTIESKIAKQYDLIVERSTPTPILGSGVIARIKILGNK